MSVGGGSMGLRSSGWLFAPIVLIWFIMIGGIGIFNIFKYDSSILRAFSPVYVYRYLKTGKKKGFTSLGGIMLSITGTEALFADLAHFPVSAIQLAFTAVVFPCLLLAYSGQAAYLMQNSEHVQDAFYRSIPEFDALVAALPLSEGGEEAQLKRIAELQAENDAIGHELQQQLEAAEKELRQVQDLFSQAADNCLNLKKAD
ncbi:putative potassium transporter 12 [Castilleja foliolosa]|uniref:Potassium transporter 12 n=1 Tax=Castilleja foliolosa TaxID=1961234 RepID=A0ABD3BHQ3_9LAMI